MSADRQTLAFYDTHAEEYAKFSDREDHRRLSDFIASMPTGARVLDLGCGIGWAAAKMAAAGLRAEAMDASQGLAVVAEERFGVNVMVASFADLTAQDRHDGIWANFSLQHAEAADRPAIFAAILAALKPGGLFVAGMHRGAEPYRDKLGRFYCPFTEPELTGLLSGFDQVSVRVGQGRGYDGRAMNYWHVSARKPAQ